MSARRAALRDATDEAVHRSVVFARDGWVCQLCGLRVNPVLAFPHEGSATIDHRIPLARGGRHSYANVQTAHFVCNRRKGAAM